MLDEWDLRSVGRGSCRMADAVSSLLCAAARCDELGRSMNGVLVFNAGSSSLKWTVLDADTEALVSHGATTWNGAQGGNYEAELGAVLNDLLPVVAVGHRVVHGGSILRQAVLVDQRTRRLIADLNPLAPLHNAAALAGIDAALKALPSVPQIAAVRHCLSCRHPRSCSTLSNPLGVDAAVWASPVRLSWSERAIRGAAQPRATRGAAAPPGGVPLGRGLLSHGCSRGAVRRYQHGLHTS